MVGKSPSAADDPRLVVNTAGDSGCFAANNNSGKSSSKASKQVLSSDLETEIFHRQEELQSEEYVRYGDPIKLFATSQYVKSETKAPFVGSQLGGYIGMYEKPDGTTRLAVPPIGDSAEGKFKESVLHIRDPNGEVQDGTVVRYGDIVILVDDDGLVWNNKCGTGAFSSFFEGYLGPRPRGTNGEVYVSFQKNGHDRKPLIYGANAVYIDVEASHRTRSSFNYRLTNYKTTNSRIQGGYIVSDGTGLELPFSVHRHSGPPVQAYETPAALKKPALTKSVEVGTVFVPPKIRHVAVKRIGENGKEFLDIMIKDPLYGTPIKLYNVTPDDSIVVDLEQENNPAELPASHLFDAAETAAEAHTGGVVQPLQFDIAVERQKPSSTSSPRKRRADGSRTLELSSVELVVERDLVVLRRAFQDDRDFLEENREFGDAKSYKSSKLDKLDVIISCHKFAMVYFICAVVLPYFVWQCILVVGELIEPIHQLSESNKSLALIERLATTLVQDFGIPVKDGKALIDDSIRSMETTTMTSSVFAIIVSYAMGLLTPEFALERTSDPTHHKDSAHSEKNAAEPETANWLISVQVPEGSWDHTRMQDYGTSTRTLFDEDEEVENADETDMDSINADPEASFKVNGTVIRGTYGAAGVDENGVPKHPAFQRFLAGEKGNLANAKARWIRTCGWRVDGKIDEILAQPHPMFHIIRKNVPNFYYGRGKQGFPVYIDCPGGVKLKNLRKAGVKLSDLLFHFTYSTEFLWTVLEPSEEGRTISILDLEGVGLFDFAGEVTDFVKKTIALSGEHYPERAHRIFIVNAPRVFKGIWSVVKPMLDESTRQKIGIYSSSFRDALLEEIDEDVLPVKYGGKNETPLGQSDEDRLLESHVCKVLMEKNVAMVDDAGKPIEGSPANLADLVDDSLVGGVSKLDMERIEAYKAAHAKPAKK